MQFEIEATPDEMFWLQLGVKTLTRREAEVFDLVLKGGTHEQISLEMGISSATVATHLSRMLQKLMVQDQRQLLRIVAAVNLANARLTSYRAVGDNTRRPSATWSKPAAMVDSRHRSGASR